MSICYNYGPMKTGTCITVFCGRYYGNNKDNYQASAKLVGKLLAESGYNVATGGGNGQMSDVSQGAHEAGGHVISIQLDHPSQEQNVYFTVHEAYQHIDDRQARLIELADGFIILPGGLGTLYEAVEIILKKTLGLIKMETPIVFINKAYYQHIKEFFIRGEEEKFFTEPLEKLCIFVDTAEEAVAYINKSLKK